MLLLAGALPAQAADSDDATGEWSPWGAGVPMLGETRFISTTLAPDPFIRTAMRSKIGYGGADNVKVVVLDLGDSLSLGLEGDVLYAYLDLHYKHAVQNWLAVYGGVNLATRLGNDVTSFFTQGVSLLTGFNLGWLIRLWEADRHMLSTAVSLSNSSTTLVDFYGYLEDVIEDRPNPSLVRDVPRLNGTVDLRYAFAATDMLGIVGYAAGTYGETLQRGAKNEWFYSLAATLHLDLARKTDLPIGLLGGYGYRSAQDPEGIALQGAHAAALNISYTGRRDFTFGVDLMYELIPTRGFQESADVFTVLTSIWYYF
jgi:hypothetical protein